MTERKLLWLEVMRGLAAIWVLGHHGKQSVDHFLGDLNTPPIIPNGFLGVDFFFVLSGFIIAMSSLRLAEGGGGLREYLSARLMRIYVPYLPLGLGMYLLYMVLPGLSESARTPGLLTTLTLVPSNSPPALSVAWTLVHEMIFYAIFSLWFVSKRVFWLAVGAWSISILAAFVANLQLSRFAAYFLSPLNLLFLLGLAMGLAHRHLRIRSGRIALFATLGGVLVVFSEANSITPSRPWIAAGFAMLVLSASSLSAGAFNPARWLMMLGTASYAVYLVHNPLLSIAVRGVRLLHPNGGAWLGMVVICVFALLGGILYWWCFERPVLQFVRSRLTKKISRPGALQPT